MAILLHRKPTGRRWGDKIEPSATKVKLEGVKMRLTTSDAWEGPCEPGEEGEYHRIWWAEVDE